MGSEQIRRFYDEHAPQLEAAMRPLESAFLGRLRRRLLLSARGHVLEVGIGSGASLSQYPPACRVTGVDLSSAMLDIARLKARRAGIEASLLQADAQSLPFSDSRFDTCVSQLSMCTVPDPVLALRELRRVCKPDGRVLLLEHTKSTSPVLAPLCLRWGPCLTARAGCHPNRPITELAAQAGLKVRRAERYLAGILVLIWAAP